MWSAIALVISLGGYLSWVLVLFIPVVMASARRIGREVRTRTRTGQDKLAEVQNILHETVTGNRIVKAFNTELWEILRFKNAAKRLFRANLRSVRIQSISSPLMDTVGAIAMALLLWIGRNEIKNGHMTIGVFGAFIFLLFKLYDPLRRFAYFYNSFQQAMGASASIFAFFDAEDDVKERPRAVTFTRFRQAIRFENVGFSYSTDEGEHQILHNVDLEVHAGEVLAMVGPSGAGKSTLVNLIPRFFDVTSGRILIDGRDLRDLTLASLRRQVAQVTQETILFNDTVHNNIAYGQPDAKAALVEQAARNALAHDFILNMPQGYDTVIGEKGFRLSGGERQRIAIARAILKNAPILILDEATSALDAESESLVQAALANLMQDRTVIVIAHRLSTIRRANRIAVLECGRITAIGSHDELLNTSPTYQKLYQLQFIDMPETQEPGSGSAVSAVRRPGCTGHRTTGVRMAISSMTGFARVQVRVPLGDEDQLSYTLTVKSVNHRFLDLQFRLPSGLDALEMELRRVLKENLIRGHVDLTLSVDRASQAKAGYNRELISGYLAAFDAARDEHKLEGEPDLNAALRLPGALQTEDRATTTWPRSQPACWSRWCRCSSS